MALREALHAFLKWMFKARDDSQEPREQVLLIGFNNHSFADHFLLRRCMAEFKSDLLKKMRKGVFTSDLKTVTKGGLKKLVEEIPRDALTCAVVRDDGEPLELKDTMSKCKAIQDIIKHRKLGIDDFTQRNRSRSIESVYKKTTDPLLRAELIPEEVAEAMPIRKTCQDYLAREMNDDELRTFLAPNLSRKNLDECKMKRKLYDKFLHLKDYENIPLKDYNILSKEKIFEYFGNSREE